MKVKSTTRYRVCIAALLFSLLVHAAAIFATLGLLQPGLDPGKTVIERAAYVAGYPWLWRAGWLFWQLTAVSDLLLSAALVAYLAAAARSSGGRRSLAMAALALAATVAAVIPDQWAEAMLVSSFVGHAAAVTAGGGDPDPYVALEARCLLMTGTCGNAGYTLMGILWMMATVDFAGGIRRHWLFFGLGACVWGLFTAAGVVNWQATSAARSGYPGFEWVVRLNALAFPLLMVWMVMMAHVLGVGHHRRHPRSDEPLDRLRWPRRGWIASLAAVASSRGTRDLMRATHRILPVPVLASDITDVVYLNWLVPAERVAPLLPPPLKLDQFGGAAFVTVLTYRHGHFGPRLLGPARRWMPSPRQSNWRLYVQPECDGAARDAIYFFKTCVDHTAMVLGSRLLSDGLPAHRAQRIVVDRAGDRYTIEIDPGGGSAPDLVAAVRRVPDRTLPVSLRPHFADWERAVRYLVDQNRAVTVHPALGAIRESRISIPIPLASVRPAELDGPIVSRLLEPIVEGCEPFVFVVPEVAFEARSERWTATVSVGEPMC